LINHINRRTRSQKAPIRGSDVSDSLREQLISDIQNLGKKPENQPFEPLVKPFKSDERKPF